ncbi:MAG: hypothetical protein AAF289_21065, partial [Cyanobacteria bacterium P01_A01_bin.135]
MTTPNSSQPSPEPSLSDRYSAFIDKIIDDTLKGKVRSKEYVYNQLAKTLKLGAGEIFERCLLARRADIQQQIEAQTNELRRAKIERQGRALSTLEEAWGKYQQTQQRQSASSSAVQRLMQADEGDRLSVLADILDPNQTYVFNLQAIEQLAQALSQVQTEDPNITDTLRRIAAGLTQGLQTYNALQPHLLGWIYESNRSVGFTQSKINANNPWNYWANHVERPLPKQLFAVQARNQSAQELISNTIDLTAWV